jgi:RNase P subunit RPR2
MQRIGLEDGMAVPPEKGNTCDECHRFLRQYHEHVVIEDSVIGSGTWRCQDCADRLETERKEEKNQQITEFVTDGGSVPSNTERNHGGRADE